ncbi:MAG: DUF4214 domain-containing protein, partial [Lachnospiraceae bacterium]|nr:DUF4214 domain-containing protein [Lachnospiraceae bacterium]
YAYLASEAKDDKELAELDAASEQDEVQIYLIDPKTGALTEIEDAITDYGDVTLSFDEPNTYYITAAGEDDYGMAVQIMSMTKIVVTGHTPEKVEEVPATSTEDGMKEHWKCKDCDVLFADEEGTTVTTAADLVIPAVPVIHVNDGSYTDLKLGQNRFEYEYYGDEQIVVSVEAPADANVMINGQATRETTFDTTQTMCQIIIQRGTAGPMMGFITFTDLKAEEQAEVDAVEELIEALPDPEDFEDADAEALAEANEAYEALSDEQKEMVDDELEEKLAAVNDEAEKLRKIEEFVTRLYNVCLDREPDEGGFKDWVSRLRSGETTGIKAAQGFIFSKEFKGNNYCNEHYVKYLYNAFMGREPDPTGQAYWVEKLEGGKKREQVFNGFARSQEFKELCEEYGIIQGDKMAIPEYGIIPLGPCKICGYEDPLMVFVRDAYKELLGRDGKEKAEISKNVTLLKAGDLTGNAFILQLLNSNEFKKRNLSNEEMVDAVYKAILGREPTANEKTTRVNQLNNKKQTIQQIATAICGSKEFSKRCNTAGIQAK